MLEFTQCLAADRVFRDDGLPVRPSDVKIGVPFWPYELLVEATAEGITLRPARQPREGWRSAFQTRSALRKGSLKSGDELIDLRSVRNRFDTEEWKW